LLAEGAKSSPAPGALTDRAQSIQGRLRDLLDFRCHFPLRSVTTTDRRTR